MSALPVAGSIAHQHVVAVLNTLLAKRQRGAAPVRILDLGVGDGRLLAYLLDVMPRFRPDLELDVHGLDVDAWHVFERKGRPLLRERHPEVDWDRRLVLVSPTAPWPYAAGYFDFILTNQVMEHVRDHRFVFGELRRCLSPAGTSVHLFPVREVAWEGHAHMPVVHWFREPRRARAMRLFAALGFDRRYREDRARRNWASHGEFARAYSSVLEKNTNYISVRELRRLAGEAGLTLSFRFTKDYFIAKLLSYAGIRPRRYCDLGGFETLLMLLLRHIASVTVVLAKTGTDLSLSP